MLAPVDGGSGYCNTQCQQGDANTVSHNTVPTATGSGSGKGTSHAGGKGSGSGDGVPVVLTRILSGDWDLSPTGAIATGGGSGFTSDGKYKILLSKGDLYGPQPGGWKKYVNAILGGPVCNPGYPCENSKFLLSEEIVPFAPDGFGDEDRPAGVTTFHHGASVNSLVDILNNGLDASKASENYTDGPGGFFVATHVSDAVFFASRNGRGGVVDVTISDNAMAQLRDAGAVTRVIPRSAKSPKFEGAEFHIPNSAFDLFNELRESGDIDISPR